MSRLPLPHTTADSFPLWGTLSARRRSAAKLLTKDEARRIAANI
jgi:hypothetical protein